MLNSMDTKRVLFIFCVIVNTLFQLYCLAINVPLKYYMRLPE